MMRDDNRYIHPPALEAPGYLANHAARVFNRLVDAALRPHGLTIGSLGPLLVLARHETLLQRDLVQALGVRQPALVAMLTKLEAAGYITRSPESSDRRAATIRLTSSGRTVAAIGGRILRETNSHGLKNLTAEEQAILIALMQRLIATFEETEATKHHL